MQYKRTLPLILVSTLFMISALTFVIPVNAYTNSFTGIGTQSCTNTCTNPITITGTVATANDILAATIQCQTQFPVSSITDTNAKGWASANMRTYATQNGAANPDGATNPANSATSIAAIWSSATEPSGAITITITFTATNTYCISTLIEANTPSIAVNTGAFVLQQFSEPNTSPNSVLSQTTINYPTVPANSIVLFFAGGTPTNVAQIMNGVTVNSPAATISGAVANALGQTFVSSSQQINNGATYNHNCCGGKGNYDSDFFISVVFSQTGALPGTPATAFTLGCTTAGTGTSKLTGNTTVYYPVWGTVTGVSAVMSNVTVDVSSVALTNSQTSAFLQVGLYVSTQSTPNGQGPSQPNGNWLLAGNQAIMLTNTGAAKNYSFNVQGTGPGVDRPIAIGVWVSHNGIFLRQAKAASQNMYFDNGTLSYKTLTQFNAATKNACFGSKVSYGASTQTVTFSNVISTTQTTTFQTITVITGTVTSTVTSAPIMASEVSLFNFLVGLSLIGGIGMVLAILIGKKTNSGPAALLGMIFGCLIGTILYVLFVDPTKAWVLAIVVVGMVLTMVLSQRSGGS